MTLPLAAPRPSLAPTTAASTSTSASVPRLSDVLHDNVDPNNIYSKPNFLKFLIDKHCFENYEFLTQIQTIKYNVEHLNRHTSTSDWFAIYNQFIETGIINLPAECTAHLTKQRLPCMKAINQIEKTLLGYLRDSYYEFIALNKPVHCNHHGCLCPNSTTTTTTTPSTTITFSTPTSADTCFTKNNGIASPDTNSICSESSSTILINKLNGTIISKNILDNLDDGDMFHYENDEVSLPEQVNQLPRSKPAKQPLISRYTVVDDNTINSHESTESEDTVVLPPITATSISSIPSATQVNNTITVNTGKSWSKFASKLKWRRRSSH